MDLLAILNMLQFFLLLMTIPYLITLLLLFFNAVFAVTMVYFLFWTVFLSHWKGAPFVPSNKQKIETMLELARIMPEDVVYDLGSGDGVLLFGAAKKGAHTVGVEINPFLVAYSRFLVWKKGLNAQVIIKKEDFRKTNLGNASVVFLYLWPATNVLLKEKLLAELPKGARIVSNSFPIAGLTPSAEKNNVFLYRV